jgi:hypothetical protein
MKTVLCSTKGKKKNVKNWAMVAWRVEQPFLPSFPPSISSVSVPFSSLSIQSRLNRYPKLENKLFFFFFFFSGFNQNFVIQKLFINNQGT